MRLGRKASGLEKDGRVALKMAIRPFYFKGLQQISEHTISCQVIFLKKTGKEDGNLIFALRWEWFLFSGGGKHNEITIWTQMLPFHSCRWLWRKHTGNRCNSCSYYLLRTACFRLHGRDFRGFDLPKPGCLKMAGPAFWVFPDEQFNPVENITVSWQYCNEDTSRVENKF